MDRKIHVSHIISRLALCLSFLLFASVLLHAQDKGKNTISGKVTGLNGVALPGANVLEKGTKNGVITDGDGNFSLTVSGSNAVLVISYVGYDNQEIAVKGKDRIAASLQQSNAANLSDVVVTALGITRSKRSVGYDVGQIKGDDMNKVAQTNVLNAMAGRVSGVAISSTSASPTSSVSIVIRGMRSLNSDNQPLFVIDGVPVKNSLSNVGTNNGNNNDVDYGNTISDLNPNDIENVSILKGPSAAALYGSRAGNGVVLITTKSGRKSKGLGMTFSTTNVIAAPYHYFPLNLDYTVGTDPYTTPNGFNSWNGTMVDLAGTDTYRFGTPLNQGIKAIQWNSPKDANGNYVPLPMVGHNNLKNFVQTGYTSINSLSIENAGEKDIYRFSYSYTTNNGIIPTSNVKRHNLSLNIDHKVNNDFKLTTSINYARSNSDNVVAGNEGALKDVAYLSPSVDVRDMKNYWLTPGIQQRKALPPVGVDESPDVLDPYDNGDNNPWFTLNQVKNGFLRNHIFGNVKASYQFSKHVNAFMRYSQDLFYENRETKMSKSYNDELNGFYGLTDIYNTESNTDFLVNYHNEFLDKFDVSASAGGNVQYVYGSSKQIYSAPGGGITAPEFFNVANIAQANIRTGSGYYQKAMYSVYATASLGYKDLAYLDLTGRNDWSSTLPSNNNSYFYPSASLSLLLNKMFNFGHNVNLFKLRGGWASVGKDTDPYNLYGTVGIGSFGNTVVQSVSSSLKNPNLKPEQAVSIELGTEIAMFNNRLRFEGTVYRSDNKNQILSISTPSSSGFTGRQINAGLIRSEGIELQVGGTIISRKDLKWDLSVNYTKNNAYILKLADGVPYFKFWDKGPTGSWTYAKGTPIPNLFDANGKQVISDGKLGQLWDNKMATVTDKNSPYYGWPLLDDGGGLQKENNGDFQHKMVAGTYNPKLLMGIQTSLTWKNITLSANVDMRLGGIFYSQTNRYMGSDAALASQLNVGIPIPAEFKNDIPGYLKAHPDQFIKVQGFQQYHLVGGPTEATGGFPYNTNGNITINDGAFYPGVYSDGNGGYIENLGDPNTTKYDNYEDAVTNGPWSFARMDMFDASFIKLRELSISTQLSPKIIQALKLQGLSVGIYTRNVILWTKAKAGLDPEMAFQYQKGQQGNGSQFRQGIEYYNITPWTIPVGIKIDVRF